MSILALMMVVSVTYAVDKGLALSESFRFISYIILFFMIKYEWNRKELLNGILGSYICTSVIICVYGIYQYFTGFGLSNEFKNYGYAKFKITATMDNPNNLAAFLILAIFPMVMLAVYEKKKERKLFYFFIAVLMLLNLAFTGSRNAIVGVAVGMVILVIMYSLKFVLPLCIVAGASAFIPEIRERIMAINDPVQN